ncbi:MAG: prepilin-type N-terminal cleavage/methylation domain-containing protein [Acidobacteria bacterium]|nr:prepilin-type N-terminal cleavage/methylation domain-containing protein [Acidobacteriota bacterium]MBI3490129.1 prepilin-type N-terminal cleavage/methylation domain-containing protein [Acidobacteriota bacterium]
MNRNRRRASQRGTSLLELTVVMALLAVLAGAVTTGWDTGATELAAAQQEIVGSLDQAFTLARARGVDVTVAFGSASGAGEHLPVQLSRGVKWGKPAHIPLPPGMDPDPLAARTGASHPVITVTPCHTTLAGAWFVHNGKEALCIRLNGKGRLRVLRWRRDLAQWTRL